jgi:hypothetical protein
MLMYRKVGIASPQVPDEIIPQYIRDMVAAEEAKRLQRQKEEEEIRNRLRIHIHWDSKLLLLMISPTVVVSTIMVSTIMVSPVVVFPVVVFLVVVFPVVVSCNVICFGQE